uniref:Nicotinamide-nucleotide adenylyltransferase n=1 Tax=Globodera rostochiensis TaxID=31243 RepID=A0A914IE71_GLORO
MNAKTLNGSRVVLLLCGSFNPPTFLHLRLFERARDFLQQNCHCRVVEGLMSPVSDHFMKPGLLPSRHRLRMAQLATESSEWIRADGWEAAQTGWTRTLEVLRHHRHELRQKYLDDAVRLVLLCGGDTVDSFVRKEPRSPDGRLWQVAHLKEIFEQFGLVVVQRAGASARETLNSPELDFLHTLSANSAIIEDTTFPNAMSSSRLRNALELGQSIRYCTPDDVVHYIHEHRLYQFADNARRSTAQQQHEVEEDGQHLPGNNAAVTGDDAAADDDEHKIK